MKFLFLLFLIGHKFTISAQIEIHRAHSSDSCNKCYCHKWHQKIEKDSVDGQVLVESKVRRGSGSRCYTDSYTKILLSTTKYYPDGKIKSIEKRKGWYGSYGHKFKISIQYFDEQGKPRKKIRTTDKVDLS